MAERRALEEQNTKKDKRIHELSARLKHSDESSKKQVDQVIELFCIRCWKQLAFTLGIVISKQTSRHFLNQWEAKPNPKMTST